MELKLLGPYAGKHTPLEHGRSRQDSDVHKGIKRPGYSNDLWGFAFSPVGCWNRLRPFTSLPDSRWLESSVCGQGHSCCECVCSICMQAFIVVRFFAKLGRMSMKLDKGCVYTVVKKSKWKTIYYTLKFLLLYDNIKPKTNLSLKSGTDNEQNVRIVRRVT